jgi:enamine deaminase RidA (YjgF/YER057c/UK114 family)
MSDFTKVNAIYGGYFSPESYPSRVAFAVAELPKGGLVEI